MKRKLYITTLTSILDFQSMDIMGLAPINPSSDGTGQRADHAPARTSAPVRNTLIVK